MTIREEINEVKKLHDEYAAIRYTKKDPISLINMFLNWHGKAATLFSRYLSANDPELQKFKSIENGNCHVLASQFGEIETPFSILIDRLEKSVYSRLEQLIIEGESIVKSIKYVRPPSGTWRNFEVYAIGNESEYQTWKNKSLRLLELNFKKDGSVDNFKEAESQFTKHHNTPKYLHDMIGVLKACEEMPSHEEDSESHETIVAPSPVTINVSQNQNQSQTQSQSVVIDIFLEAIKDEITGKQFKELKAIATEESDTTKAKSKILKKVKSFGNDVLSNIVANIITNPTIWTGLL